MHPRAHGTCANLSRLRIRDALVIRGRSDIAPLGQMAHTASTLPIVTLTEKRCSTILSKQGKERKERRLPWFKKFQYNFRKGVSQGALSCRPFELEKLKKKSIMMNIISCYCN